MKKKERICLIIPPSVFLLDERVFMPLGILKIAAVLEAKSYSVEVLDLSGVSNFVAALRDYLSCCDVVIFGITATTPQMPAVVKIVEIIRQYRIDAKIIFGGPHATLVNVARKNEVKKHINGRGVKAFDQLEAMFDVIVAGDGEEAVFKALEPTAPQLIDADDRKSELFLNNASLDVSPFPARQLIDLNSYHYYIDGERALSLVAQLGCPFGCGFCGGRKSPSFRYVRMRSVEKIIEEVELLYKTYGVKGFMFYDDELNLNSKVFIKLMNSISDLQNRLGIDFKLRGFVRPDLFNEEQAKVMYQSGFRWLLIGFESGSNQMLSNMQKKTTSIKNAVCLEIARKYGLKVKALMSVGHSGESEKTILETHDWLLKVKPDDIDIAVITVYPGTGYYDDAVPHLNKSGIWVYTADSGDKLYSIEVDYFKVADYYKGDPEGGYRSYVYTDYLTPEEIVKFRDFLEKDIRQKLDMPFHQRSLQRQYEHSIGGLPSYIFRKTGD